MTGDYLAVSSGICLCACAVGLFGEDLLQRAYRGDRAVLAYVAVHPGATARHVARAISIPERIAVRSLDRLADDGLLAVAADDETPALRSYQLAS
ncbi:MULTISPECIES: MarR family transcriptional regulator [Streptomyces]|uniref:MarR family transcriptional regulator n=1 Tax=Streptomyces TaxID=1883 RepID=UPI000D149364|nr:MULTISPECIES: helix-turn-helix domain-containing protein [Streptomyces]RZF06993.1 hypothetical protein C0R05_19120 [Streptomyces albidoflavus]